MDKISVIKFDIVRNPDDITIYKYHLFSGFGSIQGRYDSPIYIPSNMNMNSST